MRIDRIELEHSARIARARLMAELIAGGLVAISRFVKGAWHSVGSGTPRTMIK